MECVNVTNFLLLLEMSAPRRTKDRGDTYRYEARMGVAQCIQEHEIEFV